MSEINKRMIDGWCLPNGQDTVLCWPAARRRRWRRGQEEGEEEERTAGGGGIGGGGEEEKEHLAFLTDSGHYRDGGIWETVTAWHFDSFFSSLSFSFCSSCLSCSSCSLS